MTSKPKQSSNDKLPMYNVLLLGDTKVGKTSLILRFCDNYFSQVHLATIGIDFKIKDIESDSGKKMRLKLWDTAGQERYKTITTNYFKSAQGIIIAYDITDRLTFDNVKHWLEQINQFAANNICKILIGNKCDLEDKRKVSFDEGNALASANHIKFYETSSKEGLNVDDAFIDIAKEIESTLEESESNNITLRANTDGKRKKKRC